MEAKIKIGVIITNSQGEVLLIKEKANPKTLEYKWNIISGSKEEGETVEETATRECLEEVGLNIKLIDPIAILNYENHGEPRIQHFYLAETQDLNPKIAEKHYQKERGEMIIEAKWFNRAKILDLKVEDFLYERNYKVLLDWLNKSEY